MLAEVRRQVRIRISCGTGAFVSDRTGAFVCSPRVMGTTLRDLRMPESRLIGAGEVQSYRKHFIFQLHVTECALSDLPCCGGRVMDGVAAESSGPEREQQTCQFI